MMKAARAPVALSDLPPEQVIFGSTRKMHELRDEVDRLSRTSTPVLIRGESGSGKKMIAQLIHRKSPRRAGPFIEIACSDLDGIALEKELFGIENPSVGSNVSNLAMVRSADRGTLFLREIGDLSMGLQAKVLEWFPEKQERLAEARASNEIAARLVCATKRNLEEAMANGTFRADLYDRIHGVSIELPPLRERKTDIPMLAEYFLQRYKEEFDCQPSPISATALRRLEELSWPGNIRELESLIKRYVLLGSESAMWDDCSKPIARALSQAHSIDGKLSLKKITKRAARELERQIILQVLAENRGNRRQTARVLDISYRALLYKLKEAAAAGASVPRKGVRQ